MNPSIFAPLAYDDPQDCPVVIVYISGVRRVEYASRRTCLDVAAKRVRSGKAQSVTVGMSRDGEWRWTA